MIKIQIILKDHGDQLKIEATEEGRGLITPREKAAGDQILDDIVRRQQTAQSRDPNIRETHILDTRFVSGEQPTKENPK